MLLLTGRLQHNIFFDILSCIFFPELLEDEPGEKTADVVEPDKTADVVEPDETADVVEPDETAETQQNVIEPPSRDNMRVADGDEDYIPDLDEYHFEDETDEDMDIQENKPPKKKKPASRQKWSEEEVKELHDLFKVKIKELKLPGQKEIEAKMRMSLSKGGVIHKRKRDTIKKKLSNMLINIKKSK